MEMVIEAQPRTVLGKQNNKLRRAGTLPAVLYGRGKDSVNLQVSSKAFEKIYKSAGENTVVALVISGQEPRKVLIHEVAKHYMKDEPIHVDFYEVDLSRKIHAKIPVQFTGVSAAVKDLGGILVKNMNELEVEALPTDLPRLIEVNIDKLKVFADHIRVADINLGEKVKILSNVDDTIVLVQPPRTEAELAELEKPAAEAEKAAIEGMAAEEKKEEDEGAVEAGTAKEPAPAAEAKKEEKKKEEKK
ncbi:50S ribosomal protein L25 [bacterium]|nr:MAG: 50S ribosomal protein L25 [bacterium]